MSSYSHNALRTLEGLVSSSGDLEQTTAYEPRRDTWRLQTLRGWSDAQADAVFTGSTGASGADGIRAYSRAHVAVGGDRIDYREDWVQGGDGPHLGRQAERDAGQREGLSTAEKRITVLEREVRVPPQANEILRKASAYFAQAELDRPFK